MPLWPSQTVMFKGWRYCFTRFGYSLNGTIIGSVGNIMMSHSEYIKNTKSDKTDDICY